MEAVPQEAKSQSAIILLKEKRQKQGEQIRRHSHRKRTRHQSIKSAHSSKENLDKNLLCDPSLLEFLGIFCLICSSSAFTFNFVNLICLIYTFIIISVSMPSNREAASKSYTISVIGLYIFTGFLIIHLYLTIAINFQAYFINLEQGVLRLLIESLGVYEGNGTSIAICLVPDAINICSSILLGAYYYNLKANNDERKSQEKSEYISFSPSKLLCFSMLCLMGLSSILNISLIGVFHLIFVIISLIQWVNYYQIEGSNLFSLISIGAIILSSCIILLTNMMQITLSASLISKWSTFWKILGVQISISGNLIGWLHYITIILIVIIGLTYHRLQNSEPLNDAPYSPLHSTEPLLLSDIQNKSPEPNYHHLFGKVLFTQLSRTPSMSSKSSAEEQEKEDTSWFSNFKGVLKEYLLTSYVLIYLCQASIFVWIIRYNCFWSLPLALWLCYSTLFGNYFAQFILITKKLCLPYLIINTLFFYVANIPSFRPTENVELWKNFGFLIFSTGEDSFPIIDILIIGGTLILFCACIHFENTFPQQYMRRNSLREFNSFERICILILKNMDIGLIILLYLIGLSRINLLHAGLIGYFLFLFIYPNSARRCLSFLLGFMEIFVILQMLYGMLSYFIPDSYKISMESFSIIIGFYTEVFNNRMVRRVNIRSYILFLIFCVYLQYKLYRSPLYKQDDLNIGQINNSIQLKGLEYLISAIKKFVSIVYIWIAYIAFFLIVITMKATLINFLLLLLILVPTSLHLWNETVRERKGFRYTREAWIINILYCGIVVLSLYLFQFGDMFIIKNFINVFYVPRVILNNLGLLGFEQYSDADRWLSFFPYFVLLFLSVVASRHVHNVRDENCGDDNILRLSVPTAHSKDSIFFLQRMYDLCYLLILAVVCGDCLISCQQICLI